MQGPLFPLGILLALDYDYRYVVRAGPSRPF